MNRAAHRCSICEDEEPFHVHNEGRRIEGYFTVGRGQTDFQAAQEWRRRAIKAEGVAASYAAILRRKVGVGR